MPPVCPHESVNAKNNRRQHQNPKSTHPKISKGCEPPLTDDPVLSDITHSSMQAMRSSV
jgi:hypothetical protein